MSFNNSSYASFFEAAPDAMIVINKDGKILLVNKQFEALFGYTRDEILHSPIEILLPERFRNHHASYRESYCSDPHVRPMGTGMELFGRRKSGEEFFVEISLSPADAEDNLLVLATVRDSTQRKKSEEIQSRLSSIVEYSNDAILSKTLDGMITSWNPAAEQLYGYTASEMIGTPVAKIIPKDIQEDLKGILDKVKQGIKISHFETIRMHKNGKTIPVSITISPIKDARGNIIGASTVARDFSERKKVEKLKNEFISVVSHELRTPLTSIQGAIDLLLTKPAEAEQNELLNIAKKNCSRLIHLINDILDIEKIEAGKLHFNLTTADINQIIEESVAINQPYALKNKSTIFYNKKISGVQILVDTDKMQQVMANLLSNAVKFTPNGESINIEVEINGDFVRVNVIDHGSGIPKEFQNDIFKKFSQADSSVTRSKEGTGLGLSISKAIIENMNGSINYTTGSNGTTFYFDLPIANIDQNTPKNYCLIKNGKKYPSNLTKQKILLIDDDKDIYDILKKIMSPQFDVLYANNLDEAVKEVKNIPFNLVIMDLKLPDGNAETIMPLFHERKIPIIVYTAYQLDDDYLPLVEEVLIKSKVSNKELASIAIKILHSQLEEIRNE